MRHRRPLSFTVLAGVLFAALTVTPGFAQPNAESKSAAATAPASEAGVLVVAVQPGSPAEKAGIARGDIILEANGTAVNDAPQLLQAVTGRAAGDKVPFKLRHGDAEKTLTVTVGTQNGHAWFGILPFPGRSLGTMGDEDFGFGMRGYGGREGFGPGMMGPDGYGPMFPAEGAFIEGVAPGSPAEKAGLKHGDLIISVDGTTVDARNPLSDLVASKKIGDTITLSVTSRGQDTARDVKVTLEKKADANGPFLGVQYVSAPERLGGEPGHGPGTGAFVVDVAAGGPAAKAGIQARDLLIKADGTAVTSAQQVVDAVAKHKPGDTMSITVARRPDGRQTDITVTLGQKPDDAAKAWLGLSMGGGPGFQGMRELHRTQPSEAEANTPTL